MGRPGEPRNYKKEYEDYGGTPEQRANRALRNKARRAAEKSGAVQKGDGKEIDHKQMLDQGGSNAKSNQRVVDAKDNRGWRGKKPEAYGKKK